MRVRADRPAEGLRSFDQAALRLERETEAQDGLRGGRIEFDRPQTSGSSAAKVAGEPQLPAQISPDAWIQGLGVGRTAKLVDRGGSRDGNTQNQRDLG